MADRRRRAVEDGLNRPPTVAEEGVSPALAPALVRWLTNREAGPHGRPDFIQP